MAVVSMQLQRGVELKPGDRVILLETGLGWRISMSHLKQAGVGCVTKVEIGDKVTVKWDREVKRRPESVHKQEALALLPR